MRAVADLVVSDAKFPVGTSVDAVAFSGGLFGLPAAGAVVETAVVAADGTVTFTTLADGAPYALAATVDGARRVVLVRKASSFSAPAKWAAVVAARRAAIGTS